MGFFSSLKHKIDGALIPSEIRHPVDALIAKSPLGGLAQQIGLIPVPPQAGMGAPAPTMPASPVANPFAQALSQIPGEFFQDPRGLAALQALMAQYQSARPPNSPVQPTIPGPVGIPMVGPNIATQRPVGGNPFLQAGVPAGFAGGGSASIPGPAPTQATQMGRVGGFGNGGGKMTIPGQTVSVPFNSRMFAK